MYTTKAVLFDADGVVLKARDKYFSERMQEHGYDVHSIIHFFKHEYRHIILGKADLKEALSKAAPAWGWKGAIDELLGYWFSYENTVDQAVLDFVQELKQKGIKCYLASDHSKYREDDLLHNVGLSKYFNGAFFSASVGYTKEEKEYYEYVLGALGLSPGTVVFIDDDIKNVEVAKSVLPHSFVFTSVEDLRKHIS